MKQKTKLTILTILGLICTIKLSIIYYQSNYNPYSIPSFCSINEFVDCDAVATTTKSVFLGIPLSYWGMFLYLFILMLLNVERISEKGFLKILKVFKNPLEYISTLGLVSVIIAIWLGYTSLFIIHKICILCFITYVINFLIMLASTNFSNGGLGASIKTSFKDFVSGVREYTVLFFVAICLIVLFLGFTTYKMPFASKKQSIKHYLMMKKNPYKTTGNILGNEKGKIKVDIYTDYACPHCFVYNIMLHQVVRENKEILVRHHNFPLDKECNKYIDEQMHEGACRLARYAIASENQGKYWEMASMLFETQPKSDKEVMELAKGLKFDVKRFRADISSRETQKRLNQEIEEGILNGVDGTPTLVVNGKHYIGLKPYYEFKRIIMER